MKIGKCLLVGLIASCVALVSCGTKTAVSSKENKPVTKSIGTAGGQVKDKNTGLELNIPAAALDKKENISIQYIGDPNNLNDKPHTNFLGAMEFLPSGTTFDKPVEVTVELNKEPSNNELCVFCYDEETKVWDYVTSASVENKTAKFNITHFSKYETLDITPAMYEKYFELVNEAVNSGKSDSWITESYEDYLINEKHVMDYYEESGGYWYEPCGFFVGGSYQINGKTGDGDQLVKRHGESNKVGNTYGYSKVGGKTSTHREASNKSVTVDAIDVTVTIEYKMITPQIELKSADKVLSKGESTNVNVRCHYAKASNTIYPDIDLPGYDLDLEVIEGNLKLSKNRVTTNSSGKALFKVTAKDDDGGTVKAKFDVTGEFGTHAEKTIHFDNDEKATFNFAGTITQEYSEKYRVSSEEDGVTGTKTIITRSGTTGDFTLTMSYNVTGFITWRDGAWDGGRIAVNSIEVNADSSPASYTYKVDYPWDNEEKYEYHETSKTTYDCFSGGASVEANPVPEREFFVYDVPEYFSYAAYFRFDLPEYFAVATSTFSTSFSFESTTTTDRTQNGPQTNHTERSDSQDYECFVRYMQHGFAFLVMFEKEDGTYNYSAEDIDGFDTWYSHDGPLMHEFDGAITYNQTITLTKTDYKASYY